MKRLLFIIFVLSALMSNAQKYVVVRDGIKAGDSIITSGELQLIPTISNKVSKDSLNAATATFYTKAQVDSIKALKADLASPTFTGTPLVPTAAAGTNTTQAASTAFVNQTSVRKIYASNVRVSHTGDSNEYTAISFTIPAGTLSANGSLHFISLFSFTSSTNAKTFRIKIGSNVIGYWNTSSTGLAARQYHVISNRNSVSSQISANNGVSTGGGFAVSPMSAAVSTYSIDFSVSQTCTVTIQNANTGETSSIESFEVLAVY